MREIWFHDLFETSQPEYLTTLLHNKYGYDDPNPGPVVAYPPNLFLFPVGIPGLLPPKTKIAIPWIPPRLLKQIQIDLTWIVERKEAADRAIKRLNDAYSKAAWTATAVDVAAMVVLFHVGIAKTASAYVKALDNPALLAKIGKAAAADAAKTAPNTIKNVASLDPSVFTGKGSQTWRNLVRHALNLTSPSWWAALGAGLWTGDWDVWKYGLDTVHDRDVDKILRHFQEEAAGLAHQIAAMERQLNMPFYKYRVTQSQSVYTVPTAARHILAGCVVGKG